MANSRQQFDEYSLRIVQRYDSEYAAEFLSKRMTLTLEWELAFSGCNGKTPNRHVAGMSEGMLPPLEQLFPVNTFKLGFTTFSHSGSPASTTNELKIISVPLADLPLGIHRITHSLTHDVVCPPPSLCPSSNDPRLAWEAKYPKGSCSPNTEIPGGMGFYFGGPKEFAALLEQGASEAIFSYRVMFEKNWNWVKGGKLPGMCACLRSVS